MINKIVMKNVASYKNETILETDKKVNLIYGLNGTGKSTVSGFLYSTNDSKYSDCKIEGLRSTDRVLVYNQQFITDNFYETENISGIFTLSKENRDATQAIDNARKNLTKLSDEKTKIINDKSAYESKYQKQIQDFQKEVWKIKTEYSGGDRVLEFCLEKLKSNKEILFKYLLGIPLSEEKIVYTVEDLKQEVTELQENDEKEKYISKVNFGVRYIEESPLMSKAIVGNKNSSVSGMIELLGNSKWVYEGIQYVHMDGEVTDCPFCQQKTISKMFYDKIKDYFDESYKMDKAEIERLLHEYEDLVNKGLEYIEEIKENRFLKKREKEIEACIANIKKVYTENIGKLRDKFLNPSDIVSLQSIFEYETQINKMINSANDEIRVFNDKIENVKDSLKVIKEKFWILMRKEYDSIIELYIKVEKTHKEELEKYQKALEKNQRDEIVQLNIITENQKRTVNIDEAVTNIKNGLIDIGITDFTIEKYSDDEALYHLKREGMGGNVFKTLSEGEKMVISFLYFIELCKGETRTDSALLNKIIVIDDPISSLSHIYVFNVGRLIHNEFLRTSNYDQIFILTHSLYFFYELTNTDHKKREETQKLFRICKNTGGSYFVEMKYEEIQNDYQAYWHIVKDKSQAPALIANCMRNIMEYFFNFVEKQDFAQIFNRKELQETRFLAFNRYMNRESHSKGQNIFDIKEFDYDNFRDAFKLVFEIEGYSDHYQKMIK
ncbi:MAG: AAA family ATPase [Ruminococcus flavefaciens]|nr:AAA family ATPase [Ruminococcus flavefaciens]